MSFLTTKLRRHPHTSPPIPTAAPDRRTGRRRTATTARLVLSAVLAPIALMSSTGCSPGTASSAAGPLPLRLGYFPTLTHATPIVGVARGILADALGPSVKLDTRTFNAGPAATEALFSGAIDAAYLGPNPTINAFGKSQGRAITVVSGAASGGVALVVKPSITSAGALRGTKIATPQLGNTQDVALRYWLRQQGLKTTLEGGGDVAVIPQDNAQTLQTFGTGAIDGAWVPEPFVSRLVNAGGRVLLDERDLWPDRRFVITNLVVRTAFLKAHPDVVDRLLTAQVAATTFLNRNPEEAQRVVSDHIGRLTGKPLDLALAQRAWPSLTFLNDPLAASLATGLDHAVAVGLSKPVPLRGLYDLSHLNRALVAAGQPEVPQP